MRICDDLAVCETVEETIEELSKQQFNVVSRHRKSKSSYVDITCTLDIETTNTEVDGFLYSIQTNIAGVNTVFRYVEDFIELCEYLIKEMALCEERRLVFYVHNLSYEHFYLTQILESVWGMPEYLFTKPKKPLFLRWGNGIEFRDSYKLFQKNLEKTTEDCKHAKAVGDLDYTVYRTPDTVLTDEEYRYIVYDVQGLYEAVENLKEKHGYNQASLPLTNTALVIKEVNRKCGNDREMKKACKDLTLDKFQMRLAYKCMAGGDTHGTRWRSGKVYRNGNSYDFKSAHPSQMLLRDFPCGKPISLPADTTLEELDRLRQNGYGWIAKLYIADFTIKSDCPDPTLSVSKCEDYVNHRGFDNGRLLGADACICYMDSNDFERFRCAYDVDLESVIAVEAVAFRLAPLPIAFRKAIFDKFIDKEFAEDEFTRIFAKICVNTIFGACAQKTIREETELTIDDFLETDTTKWEVNLESKSDEEVEKSQKMKFPFLWGLWTSSCSRLELFKMMKAVGWEKVIYWDTDSVKYEGEKSAEVEEYNRKHIVLVKTKGYDFVGKKGGVVYVGIAEDEHPVQKYGYQEFTFLHAKCYACKTYNKKGEVVIESTIAGVGKKEGVNALEGDIANLKDGLVIEDAGGLELSYHDRAVFTRHDFKRATKVASFIYMTNRTYEVKHDKMNLEEIEQLEYEL